MLRYSVVAIPQIRFDVKPNCNRRLFYNDDDDDCSLVVMDDAGCLWEYRSYHHVWLVPILESSRLILVCLYPSADSELPAIDE